MRNEQDGRGLDPRADVNDTEMADDRPIEELFAASRREQLEVVPDFDTTLRAARGKGDASRDTNRPRPMRWVFLAASATTCAGAVLGVAMWSGLLRAPGAGISNEDRNTRSSSEARTLPSPVAGKAGGSVTPGRHDLQNEMDRKLATLVDEVGAKQVPAPGDPASAGTVQTSILDVRRQLEAEAARRNAIVIGSSFNGPQSALQPRAGYSSIGPAPGNGASRTLMAPRSGYKTVPSQNWHLDTVNGPFLGHTYSDALAVAPGVMNEKAEGGAHGARDRDFRATVDGVSNVDPLTGTFMSNVNADAVETVKVTGEAPLLAKNTGSMKLGTVVGDVRASIVGSKNDSSAAYDREAGDQFQAALGFVVFEGTPSPVNAGTAGKGLVDMQVEWSEEHPFNTEAYRHIQENDFLSARENPLSTFSIDVDTASYSNVRRFLESGSLPPAGAIRLEELINYFPYDDPPPNGEAPFATRVEIAGCPWNASHRLARIALKAEDVSARKRSASNLVFLIDVSGSMSEPAKLPLVVSSLKMLVGELDGRDRIAMVVYAGASGLVLPPTSGSDRATILAALDRLQSGGGTNGGEGLLLAYQTARKGFIPGGVNRVILATDGDFNLGVTDRGQLLDMIARESGGGIFLTALGFGMGNYKDDFMETLADKGNGNYAYIDSPREARKVLVDGMGGTLVTVAKDVKIQVEFNPARVDSYRLIGYENRLLAKEDFNDDTKDAGEIGAGHSVTALYELVPAGSSEKTGTVDPLRYQKAAGAQDADGPVSAETLTVKLRYKEPEGTQSKLLEVPAIDSGATARAASPDFKFAASVAMFGMVLRNSPHRGDATLEATTTLASQGLGRDPGGYRADFQRLAGIASRLRASAAHDVQPVSP